MMPELDTAIPPAKSLQRAISQELHNYQLLIDRADQLTQQILQTQKTVDALKDFTKIAEHYQSQTEPSPEHWIIQLRSHLDQATDTNELTEHEITNSASVTATKDHLYDTMSQENNLERLQHQYQQHRASCQLMEQHCEQSHHYLQLLQFQVDQMREAIKTLLSHSIDDSNQIETIATLQERVLKMSTKNA